MKCPYESFECDWPVATGDIECAECVHYLQATKSTSIFDWLFNLADKIFPKK